MNTAPAIGTVKTIADVLVVITAHSQEPFYPRPQVLDDLFLFGFDDLPFVYVYYRPATTEQIEAAQPLEELQNQARPPRPNDS